MGTKQPWSGSLAPAAVPALPCLALLAAGFAAAQPGDAGGRWWSMPALILWLVALALLVAGLFRRRGQGPPPGVPEAPPAPPADVDDLFAAERERASGAAIILEGRLLMPAREASGRLLERFRGTGWTAILTSGEDGTEMLVLIPAPLAEGRRVTDRRWLHLVLFLATLATTTWAGAVHQGVDVLREPARLSAGLPYSLALMLILGAHELGHYLAARRHGMSVSLPYFIPIPFGLGTFGAFISLRSLARSRAALFDVAVAGPLAGLVFAVPALLIGLPLSTMVEMPEAVVAGAPGGGTQIGSSLLLTSCARMTLGGQVEGHALMLHPLAFAGWLGLVVTALNLLPVGQLDGGHTADAMFGRRAGAMIGVTAMFALFALGLFVWSGLLFWAFIVFFMAGRKGLPPLDDLTPLGPFRRSIGWFAFALLLAIIAPVPRAFLESLGIHCPYV